MTDPDRTPEDERIGRALQARATDAPRAEDLAWDLAATARNRVRRRRNATMGVAAALVAVIGFGGVWSLAGPETFTADSGNDSAGSGEVASAPERAATAPATPGSKIGQTDSDGWRWESYGGVEVSVPKQWGYGVTGEPWCIDNRGQADGVVGRPGAVRDIKCPDAIPTGKLGQHVWFSRSGVAKPPVEELGSGWSRDTMLVGGVLVEVQTRDAAVRDRILRSIHQIGTTDSNGCPVRHPITTDQQPYDVPAGRGLSWDAVVTGLAACRYEIRPGGPAPLVGSLRFTAARSTDILTAIRQQPGANPAVRMPKCMPDVAPPAEAIVLLFDTPDGQREIRVGYDGCVGAGFFNGTGSRGLYAAPLRLFAIGPVRPTTGSLLTSLFGW